MATVGHPSMPDRSRCNLPSVPQTLMRMRLGWVDNDEVGEGEVDEDEVVEVEGSVGGSPKQMVSGQQGWDEPRADPGHTIGPTYLGHP